MCTFDIAVGHPTKFASVGFPAFFIQKGEKKYKGNGDAWYSFEIQKFDTGEVLSSAAEKPEIKIEKGTGKLEIILRWLTRLLTNPDLVLYLDNIEIGRLRNVSWFRSEIIVNNKHYCFKPLKGRFSNKYEAEGLFDYDISFAPTSRMNLFSEDPIIEWVAVGITYFKWSVAHHVDA